MSELTSTQQEELNTFVSITGADVSVAKQFLSACSWNSQNAIDRFFTYNGDPSKLHPDSNSAPITSPSLPTSSNPISNMLSSLFSPNPGGVSSHQQPLSSNQPLYDDGTVRQADSYFSETMVNPAYNTYGSSFYKQKSDNLKNFGKEWSQGHKNQRTGHLSTLFADPEYKFLGSLEAAKAQASNSNKWLLCNIQEKSNFASHCLNRDVWKDIELQPIIEANFVFYQWGLDTDNGQRLRSLYQVTGTPSVFVIDPKTGRLEWEFHVPQEPNKVLIVKNKIMSFLEDHPDPSKKPKKIPVVQQQTSPKISSEEKELQEAIAMSIANEEQEMKASEGFSGFSNDSSKQEKDFVNGVETTNDAELGNNQNKEKEEEQEEKEQYMLNPEPDASDKEATAIRCRIPGKILQRRFKTSAKVQELFAWISEEAGNKKITLIQPMPRLDLTVNKEKTLAELGLIRATINCSFDDE